MPIDSIENFDFSTQRACIDREKLAEKRQCDECDQPQEAIRVKSFPQLPRILIIHLSRFVYDHRLTKIQEITHTPMELDCFCTECTPSSNKDWKYNSEHKYKLYAVLCHLGESQRSGHYFAYARSFGKKTQQNPCENEQCCAPKFEQNIDKKEYKELTDGGYWYYCNDTENEVVTEEFVYGSINQPEAQATPYVLFYARNDLLDEC